MTCFVHFTGLPVEGAGEGDGVGSRQDASCEIPSRTVCDWRLEAKVSAGDTEQAWTGEVDSRGGGVVASPEGDGVVRT